MLAKAMTSAVSDEPVPSCPDWTARDLVGHVTQVYAHKAAVLRAGKAVPGKGFELPDDAPLYEALERHDATVTDLADVLAGLAPDAPAWTWMEGAGELTVAAWARRMAHEAYVHRVDAELTVGAQISPVDDRLAVDGINELLTWIGGDPDVVASEEASAGTPGTLLFDYGDGAWLVDLADGTQIVTPTATTATADTRIAGAPAALDLLLWGRPSPVSWPVSPHVDRLRARITKSAE